MELTTKQYKAVESRLGFCVTQAELGHDENNTRKIEIAAYQASAIFGVLLDIGADSDLVKYAHDCVKKCSKYLDL